MFFKIDFKRLHKDKGSLCRCLFKSAENNKTENICPCDGFTDTMKCRCGMFKSVDDFNFFEKIKICK